MGSLNEERVCRGVTRGLSREDGKTAQVEASLQRKVFGALVTELAGRRESKRTLVFSVVVLKRKLPLLTDTGNSKERAQTFCRGSRCGLGCGL